MTPDEIRKLADRWEALERVARVADRWMKHISGYRLWVSETEYRDVSHGAIPEAVELQDALQQLHKTDDK